MCLIVLFLLVMSSDCKVLVNVNFSLHNEDSLSRFNLSLQNNTGIKLEEIQELPEIDIEVDICVPGYYCPADNLMPIPCPKGTYNPEFKGESLQDCLLCPRHYFCPLASVEPLACPNGHFTNVNGSKDASDCDPCPQGFYCPFNLPIPCPPGTYQILHGETSNQSCLLCPLAQYCPLASIVPFYCPAGTFQPSLGGQTSSSCLVCPSQAYCPEGSAVPIPCAAGLYRNIIGGSRYTDCVACPANHSCNDTCPSGTYQAVWECLDCPVGFYCLDALVIPCSAGSWQNETGSTQCKVCENGTYSKVNSSICPACPSGSYCNTEVGMQQCSNHTNSLAGARYPTECSCEPGYQCSVLPFIIVSVYIDIDSLDVAQFIPVLQEWIIQNMLTQRPSEMTWLQ